MFKSSRQSRSITIIIWVIAVFVAIIKLPGLTNLITDLNDRAQIPSQISQSKRLINADHLQRGWGRRLSRTSTMDVVFYRSKSPITPSQQSQINRRMNRLQKRAPKYGIQKITDLNSDRNGADELKSKDNSTETVQLNVDRDHRNANEMTRADKIGKITRIKSLKSAVTSPSLLKAEGIRSTIHMTIIVTIIGFLLSSIALGLIFRSLILPVISAAVLLITELVTLSLAGNLSRWTGFNEYIPLSLSIIVLIFGTLLDYTIARSVIPEFPLHRDANNAVQIGLDRVKHPVELSGLILTLALGAAIIIPEAVVRPVACAGIAFAITTLAELTLFPTFISWTGKDALWPGNHYGQPKNHKLWDRLSRLSLWQPLISIVAVIYFVMPFAYSYHNNFEYGQDNNVTESSPAKRGLDALNAHFTAGKSTPVTVYLKSPKKFNNEKSLKPLDDLTSKLQSMPGVNSVYSVTQPSGMPVRKYYVDHQLNAVNDDLNRSQNQLNSAKRQLKSGQKALSQKKLNQIGNRLSQLPNIKGQLPQINLGNQPRPREKRIAGQLSNYRNQLQALNGKLNRLSGSLSQAGTVSNYAKGYQHQIKSVGKKVSSAIQQIKKVNGSLNTAYGYLSNLQRSAASRQYFITPEQIQDTDFQQSLINFTSQDERTTKLTVVFSRAPSPQYNQTRIKRLNNEVRTQLQGTPLSNANVVLSGVPIQQATIQKNFKRGAIAALFVSLGIIITGLILISRSVLNPLFWIFSFGISTLAGLQITELIVRYATNQTQFNWQIMLAAGTVLIGIATLELIPISLSYRHRRVDLIEWLHEAFTSLGQNVTAVLIITILTVISLVTGMSYQMTQISLIITITVIIFNGVLPILASALGKYTKTLPHSRL